MGYGGHKYLKNQCEDDETTWFACPHSTTEFYGVVSNVATGSCEFQEFDRLCSDDPHFYQACGHGCHGVKYHGAESDVVMLCNTFVCESYSPSMISSGKVMESSYHCQEHDQCLNINSKILHGSTECDSTTYDELSHEIYFTCVFNSKWLDRGVVQTVWDKIYINESKVCNEVCDCPLCDDEAECNNVTYGMFCYVNNPRSFIDYIRAYVDPGMICVNSGGPPTCPYGMERRCMEEEIVRVCQANLDEAEASDNYFEEGKRVLKDIQICSVPLYGLLCADGLDQVNCTDSARVVLWCDIEGYNSSVSKFALCQGSGVCDDQYPDQCEEVDPVEGCLLHKNELCNGIQDCANGADEGDHFCKSLTKVLCKRRVRRKKEQAEELGILLEWVMDGRKDCIDGEDETESLWESCHMRNSHTDLGFRFFEKGTTCQDALICPEEKKTILLDDLCNGMDKCEIEQPICRPPDRFSKPFNKVVDYTRSKSVSYCLPGLESLHFLKGGCEHDKEFAVPDGDTPDVDKTILDVPEVQQDCKHSHGEMYVFLSCSGLCNDTNCPLSKPSADTCKNKPDQRVFGLTQDNHLRVLLQKTGGRFTNQIFPCENKNCVLYSVVCNLVDDCGDGSDERNCSNSFQCASSQQRVPLTAKCDGVEDCKDFSDECSEDCGLKDFGILRGSTPIKTCSWGIGFLAVSFNLVVLPKSIYGFRKVSSLSGAINKCLVLLIALADLLMGAYLIAVAYIDLRFDNYCKNKYVWLSSKYCAILGIISTVTSQVSLFSMTALSVTRASSLGQIIPRSISGAKSKCTVLVVIVTVVGMSVLTAVLPLLPVWEDYFGNGLYYHDNNLFRAEVSKDEHYSVFREFYGTSRSQEMSWNQIRSLVGGMFTSEYGGNNFFVSFATKFRSLTN